MVRIDKKQQRRVTDKIVCHPSVTILNIYISDNYMSMVTDDREKLKLSRKGHPSPLFFVQIIENGYVMLTRQT